MFRLLEAITLLCSAWRWIIIVETCCHKVLKKEINKVVLDYILSIYLIIGYPHLENVEPSKYLCSMLANDGRCTCEIKSRIIMAKATFNKKRVFYWHIGLKIDEETSKMLHLEHSFIWCWNLDASGSRSETPGEFWNVFLEKDREDQLDRSCEKWRSIT